jgi:hypothetical protein
MERRALQPQQPALPAPSDSTRKSRLLLLGTDAITSGSTPNAPHRAAGEPRIAPWTGALLLAVWCREPKLAPWVAVIWPLVLVAGRWPLVGVRLRRSVCLPRVGFSQAFAFRRPQQLLLFQLSHATLPPFLPTPPVHSSTRPLVRSPFLLPLRRAL